MVGSDGAKQAAHWVHLQSYERLAMAAIKFSRIRPIMACPKQYWAPLSAIAELARSVISSSRSIHLDRVPRSNIRLGSWSP
jgi:hypothetical protein